ncbi:signal peptidase I SipW [Natribacillus halophilus]|uniref:Signal peptidase I n=1 Tax=Natribacillus halophilus TaxID=549003 RepID=A0A1G8MUM4_9BACI|nr:signal peptidase I [Natribacillus halophilus]SDI71566.1 Signal peptidase I Serine peptidase. MEROPS family S26B [Natribacillus halophilus]
MWRVTGKVISGFTTTLLFALLVVTLFAVISSQAAEGEPNVFGYELKTVLSGSMEPEIQTGSMIAIQSTEHPTQFEQGDVITFTNADDNLVTHRVHEVENDGQQYITKGDNNNSTDSEPVLAENIVGEYTGWTVPFLGYAFVFATSEQGAVLLLILPGVLLLAYSAFTIGRALRQIEPSEKKEETVSPPRQE